MSPSLPNIKSPMEKASTSSSFHSLSLAEPFGFLFLHIIVNWIFTLQKLSLGFLSFILTCPTVEEQQMKSTASKATEDSGLSREDMEMVMERLGLYCREDGDQLKEYMGLDELAAVFEDKEPSLEELKEAFCLFDGNHDGFIDAVDLQSLLSKLGFREGLSLDACQEMIAVHDQSQDGLIDFHEFVKFMESSFC